MLLMLAEKESFWALFCSPAHWLFELFLMALFDGLIGMLLWPKIRTHWQHHIERDIREAKQFDKGQNLTESNNLQAVAVESKGSI